MLWTIWDVISTTQYVTSGENPEVTLHHSRNHYVEISCDS